MPEPGSNMVVLARNAMATRFEIVLHGADPVALRAAGEEALDEVDRLEGRLSLFRPESEIAHVNARAFREPVVVSPEVFRLLRRAEQLHAETEGAFDITIAPLVRCWGFLGASGAPASADSLVAARANVGMRFVELDASQSTVRFSRRGVMIDLGAIGKGYAVEQAADVLREAGVSSALIHGGTSTAYALGCPPDAAGWNVVIEGDPRRDEPEAALPRLSICDEAMSVSAVWGKWFDAGGRMLGHVIDPRDGQPACRAMLAAVVLPSATETDALSTALLVRGPEGQKPISELRPGMRTLVVGAEGTVTRTPVVE